MSGHVYPPTGDPNWDLGEIFDRARASAESGDVKTARVAYEQVMSARHPDLSPKAAYSLGIVLSRSGDKAGARAAYQWAADSGHWEMGPMASVKIGRAHV